MEVSEESSVVNVTCDMGNGGEGYVYMGGVVHRQEKACYNLNGEAYSKEEAKVSPCGDIDGGWEVNESSV